MNHPAPQSNTESSTQSSTQSNPASTPQPPASESASQSTTAAKLEGTTAAGEHLSLDVVRHPELQAESAWVAPTATVIGHVQLGQQSSVWFGAVIRGDCERVVVGDRTNVQDLACLHADPGLPCVVGNDVTIGHAAIVHGAVVEDECLIGIRATILNGARIGKGSLIGAAALVTEGAQIPPNSLVLGVPGKVVRQVSPAERERIVRGGAHYVEAAAAFQQAQQTQQAAQP